MEARFNWVVSGLHRGDDAVCDVDLRPSAKFAVVPTLGSLLPGWVLLIPRRPALSISLLSPSERKQLRTEAAEAASILRSFGTHVVCFEHGPSSVASVVGCGVDQAHLHVVPLDFDLVEAAQQDKNVDWKPANPADPWSDVTPGSEYYLVMSKSRCLVGTPKSATRQYFRRLIANHIGKPDKWDYRAWAFNEHVERTISHFSGAVRSREATHSARPEGADRRAA